MDCFDRLLCGDPLVVGLVSFGSLWGLLALVGLFHSLASSKRTRALRWSALLLSGAALVGMACAAIVIWEGDLVRRAASTAHVTARTAILAAGHVEVMELFMLTCLLLVLPLGLGIFLFIRGASLPVPGHRTDEQIEKGASPKTIFVAQALAGAGLCLGAWAVVDWLHFDDVLLALMMAR